MVLAFFPFLFSFQGTNKIESFLQYFNQIITSASTANSIKLSSILAEKYGLIAGVGSLGVHEINDLRRLLGARVC